MRASMSHSTRSFWRRALNLGAVAAAAAAGTLGTAQPSGEQAPLVARDLVVGRTIEDLQRALTGRDVTSVALVDAYLARIAAYDQDGPRLNAMISLNPRARAEAAALDAERAAGRVRGPLHGVPLVIKDNYDTADMPTTGSTIALATLRPARDAFQVARLRRAGAVIVGKTNLHELAAGIVSVSSLGGQTRNPYDPSRNPGGSSGGTGAAIAASFAAAGLGSDTCGSIRVPAAHNHLVGLRPTMGLTSRSGIMPLSHSQDVGGPIARSIRDLAVLLDATAGQDPDDASTSRSAGRTPASYLTALRPGALAGARLGVVPLLFGDMPEDREVETAVRGAVDRMRTAGATIVEVEVPDLAELLRTTSVIDAEFKFDLSDYLAANPGAPVRSLGEILDRGLHHQDLDATFRRRNATASRDSDAYRATLARRETLAQAVAAVLTRERLAALVYPPIRRKAALIGEPQGGGNNCQLAASTGLPALALPAGFTADGLPVGLELVGPAFSEVHLLNLGLAFEQVSSARRLPASTPPLTGTSNDRQPPSGPSGSPAAAPTAGPPAVSVTYRSEPSTRTFTYAVTTSGVRAQDVLLVALHRDGADGNGPVVAPLIKSGLTAGSGTLTLREAEWKELLAGTLHVRLYTRDQPLGAARARLQAAK